MKTGKQIAVEFVVVTALCYLVIMLWLWRVM